VAAHPALEFAGNPGHQGVIRNNTLDDGARRDKCESADGGSAYDRGVGADGSAVTHQRAGVLVMSHDFRAWIGDIGEDAGGTAENIILELDAGIEGDVVLNFDIVADYDAARHVHVLAQNALPPDVCILHDMAEMPDLGPGPDGAGLVDVGARMYVVILRHRVMASNQLLLRNGWIRLSFGDISDVRILCTSSMEGLASSIPKPRPARVSS
jgi:hypothetical protein